MSGKSGYGSVQTSLYRRRSSLEVYKTFLGEFNASTGAQLVTLLGFLTALGIGGLIGTVPQVVTQRFAELQYGLEDGIQCSDVRSDKPHACAQGSDYAQSAASYMMLVRNLLALMSNSLAGSYSDTHGRRAIQILTLVLMAAAPVAFLAIQVFPTVHPLWYYIFDCFSGVINPFSIAFTQLSDALPPRHRAPAYGMFMGSFMAGIAVSPMLATLLSNVSIAIFSTVVRFLALWIAVVWLPETLSEERRLKAAAQRESNDNHTAIWDAMTQPFRKLAILFRSSSLMLVALGAFTSKMVFSADVTLFFYYVENNLGATVHDVGTMMLVSGFVGVLVQAGLLKYFIALLGEHRLLVATFGFGVLHNLVYGLAANKNQAFVGICISPLTNMNMPLLSSLASRMVASTEQGQIQGALYGLTSLAEATGPVLYNYVHRTWHAFGPGTMFVVGSMLFGLGMLAISLVPPKSSICDADDESDASEGTVDGSREERQELLP